MGKLLVNGELLLSILKVDSRGRLTLPKEFRAEKVVAIPAGSFLILIPVPAKPREAAKSWLKSEKSVRKLRELAEREARREAVERARRRGQL